MSRGTMDRRWAAYSVVLAASITTMLDTSKVNVGLPAIAAALHASDAELQLAVAAYLLAFGMVLIPAGRLGDEWSRRRLFMLGLGGFVLTSIACATASNAVVLIVARIFEGFATGLLMPQGIGLIQQLFQGSDRARAFGYFGAISGITLAIGPTIGGLLVGDGSGTDGWRWIFWINVPLGLGCLFAASRWLPADAPRGPISIRSLDPIGTLILTASVLSLMLPFVLPAGSGSGRWWLIGLGVAVLIGFVAWERRQERNGRPVAFPLALFRIPAYALGVIIGFTSFAGVTGIVLVQTLYLQQGLGLSPLLTGLLGIPFSAGAAVASWLGGRVIYRFGSGLVLLGVSVLLLGCLIMMAGALWAPVPAIPWALALGHLVAGIGGGFNVTGNQVVMLSRVRVSQGGVAGSVGQLGQRIGSAIGLAVISGAFFAALRNDSLAAYTQAFAIAIAAASAMVLIAVIAAACDRTKLSDAPRDAPPARA